ncbi:MAG: dihydroorotate dehydrogenase-like protein [Oligoflexia bacterium]|nr:dihydroorotate dehydrogenase-like protein [Oligoflexia bacterium]
MKLTTRYLGLELKNPLLSGASPFTDRIDGIRRLEDAGASAIVLRSLFEEQIAMEENAYFRHATAHAGAYAEASEGLFPFQDFAFDTERYLEHLRQAKKATGIPVIGSLNGITHGGWERYSKLIEEAGADALELNFYELPTHPNETAAQVEGRYLEILKAIRAMVRIPIAVKLSPFFSSLPNFAQQLAAAGADGLVLFNRLYQPDIDTEALQAAPTLKLSDSSELPLRLRCLAILEPHFRGSLAVSGGVHTSQDAIKALMTGATGVQVVSALLQQGPSVFTKLAAEIAQWLTSHEYESLEQLRGSMSLRRCPDPDAFTRGNYMKILHGWAP